MDAFPSLVIILKSVSAWFVAEDHSLVFIGDQTIHFCAINISYRQHPDK